MGNPYEDAARQRKVTRLVTTLLAAGCDADVAAGMTQEMIRLAAAAAGVIPPSTEAWEMVVAELRRHETAAQLAHDDDPFACSAGGGNRG